MVPKAAILAVDIGTTHCKAGLFALDGSALKIVTHPMVALRASTGEAYFDPEALWATAATVIRKVADKAVTIAAIGIASMAETGLLVDRRTAAARSFFGPWFHTAAPGPGRTEPQAIPNPLERYPKTGLPNQIPSAPLAKGFIG